MNKLENTLENKARFFALYWGQQVLKTDYSNRIYKTGTELSVSYITIYEHRSYYLELTPLSQISDEDVKGLTNSFMRTKKELLDYYCSESHGQALKMLFKDLKPEDYDYLRSKGYALPWMGLSVDDLVNYGWVKLKGGSDE